MVGELKNMNMVLWDKVCKTNPAHTKKVKFGRAITAIDPIRQIENVTEQFGAATDGWGFEVVNTVFLPTDQVACQVRFWTDNKDNYVEQYGQAGLYMDGAKKKPDTDCMKKAVTDALTKCFTYLGFNADVFQGKFDDNKYVQQVKAEFKKKEGEGKPPEVIWLEETRDTFRGFTSYDQLSTFGKQKDTLNMMEKLSDAQMETYNKFFNITGERLAPQMAAE